MLIQNKVQNWNEGMTREGMILARTVGTLRQIGKAQETVDAIVERAKNPEENLLSYLRDKLITLRCAYAPGSNEYTKLDNLIKLCNEAEAKAPKN